jgi:hypothetical protein
MVVLVVVVVGVPWWLYRVVFIAASIAADLASLQFTWTSMQLIVVDVISKNTSQTLF